MSYKRDPTTATTSWHLSPCDKMPRATYVLPEFPCDKRDPTTATTSPEVPLARDRPRSPPPSQPGRTPPRARRCFWPVSQIPSSTRPLPKLTGFASSPMKPGGNETCSAAIGREKSPLRPDHDDRCLHVHPVVVATAAVRRASRTAHRVRFRDELTRRDLLVRHHPFELLPLRYVHDRMLHWRLARRCLPLAGDRDELPHHLQQGCMLLRHCILELLRHIRLALHDIRLNLLHEGCLE
ncbi:unnamed protein product [Linum trigynum]|uniref:Uncharacterized protein n=1 Tax=Linum trigynum TaxID=586398 RepID=A0AAV2GA75_9ROSI